MHGDQRLGGEVVGTVRRKRPAHVAQVAAKRIAAGEDPEAIRAWLVERYGDYVSYAPRVTALTWPLFVLPALLAAAAGLAMWRRFARKGGR